MLLYLVLWTFVIALAPLALGLAWQQTIWVVRGLASSLYGPSAWPGERHPVPAPRLKPTVLPMRQSQAVARNIGRKHVK
jgi:hypothetical protein